MAVQQEGLDSYNCEEQYFDIMLVGMTGQGKSTTADKLLIANPDQKRYKPPVNKSEGPAEDQESDGVRVEDITMWQLSSDNAEREKMESYLRSLLECRASEMPHLKVNEMRMSQSNASTSSCQVLSNDTTKTRILDVPGFFDRRSYEATGESEAQLAASISRLQSTATSITSFNFGITRDIIRIQAALGMCFRRVVYFLPTRGPLERPSAILASELEYLDYVFGTPIFECMVVVATIYRRHSLKDESDEEKFPDEDVKKCEEHFQIALSDVFLKAGYNKEDVPKVPIIFLSLSESCESILRKIQGARVSRDKLELRFNPNACIKCGMRIGCIKTEDDKEERVTCSFLRESKVSILYEESKCHPVFKRSLLSHLLGRDIAKKIARKWPSYKDEYCAECKRRPFEPGCLQIGQKYKVWWGKVYDVDHTSDLADPIEEPAHDDQPDAGCESALLAGSNAAQQGVRADHLDSRFQIQSQHLVARNNDLHLQHPPDNEKCTENM